MGCDVYPQNFIEREMKISQTLMLSQLVLKPDVSALVAGAIINGKEGYKVGHITK